MDSFRRDPGETSERGAKRPRLPAVFEAVKAGRFDELSLTGEIVAQALTFLVWELEELKKQNKTLSDQLKSNALLIDTLRQTITVTQTMTTTTTKATEATRVASPGTGMFAKLVNRTRKKPLGRRGRSGAGVVAAPEAERVLGEGVGEPGRPRTRGVSMCGEVHEVCVVCVGAEDIDLLVASRASSRAYPASRDARGVKAVP